MRPFLGVAALASVIAVLASPATAEERIAADPFGLEVPVGFARAPRELEEMLGQKLGTLLDAGTFSLRAPRTVQVWSAGQAGMPEAVLFVGCFEPGGPASSVNELSDAVRRDEAIVDVRKTLVGNALPAVEVAHRTTPLARGNTPFVRSLLVPRKDAVLVLSLQSVGEGDWSAVWDRLVASVSTTAPASADGSSKPTWPLFVGAGLFLLLLAAVALRPRRRPKLVWHGAPAGAGLAVPGGVRAIDGLGTFKGAPEASSGLGGSVSVAPSAASSAAPALWPSVPGSAGAVAPRPRPKSSSPRQQEAGPVEPARSARLDRSSEGAASAPSSADDEPDADGAQSRLRIQRNSDFLAS